MNYIIEDNIDFYAELHKLTNEENNTDTNNTDTNNSDTNNNNICMLTHLPLTENFITLPCNHTFNYIPLYNEVCTKYIYNNFESERLNDRQIKCPYCRKIYNHLLPYIPYDGVEKEIGVNWPEKDCMRHMYCQWVYKCGKNKGESCDKNAYKKDLEVYCVSHWTIVNKKKNTDHLVDVWTDEMDKLCKSTHIVGLKKMLKEMNLPVSGTKKVLVKRIIDAKK